jgi:hydrogenase/urease accessory protein HupE
VPAWFIALIVLAISLVATPVFAHQTGRSYCTVKTVPGGIDVGIETAFSHLAPAAGITGNAPSEAEVSARKNELLAKARADVSARTANGACSTGEPSFQLVERDGERATSLRLSFSCPSGAVTLRNAWRFDVDPQAENVCAIDGAAWVFRPGLEEKDVGAPPSFSSMLGNFVRLGTHHVFTGIDHVLFVIALLVAAARASRDESVMKGLKGMAAEVTGFTLRHSVTLIAAGLELVRLDSRITESVIALSIVVVGVENIVRKEVRWRALTATLFGLVHGFGFASVLSETELPPRGAVWALFSFNVGIELAQLIIVALVFPLLAFAARRGWYEKRLLVPVSGAVALLATVWFVKRATGSEFLPWIGG